MDSIPYHQFKTTPNGLSKKEVFKRIEKYGQNQLVGKKHTPLIFQFFEEFKDLMVIILCAAAIIAAIVGETADAFIILFIVILNACIGFLQKYKAEKAIEALQKLIAPTAKVLREGNIKKIQANELVPGDIIIIEEGDQIGADSLLIEENELETQEAALTGESAPVVKNALNKQIKTFEDDFQNFPEENRIYMGTAVTHGSGRAIVINTGMKTEMGKIAKLTTETKKDKSPMEKELHNLGIFVGKLTFIITALLFLYGLYFQGRAFIDTLLFSVSVAVAAVPEGLPTTITIALALGVQRLAKSNAIMKQLSSVETLGATTVICSDKTGTLTKNEMTVKELYFDHYHATVSGVGYSPTGAILIEQNNKNPIELITKNIPEPDNLKKIEKEKDLAKSFFLFLKIAGFCNNASILQTEKGWEMVGDPTEGALLSLVKKSGIDFENIHNEYEKIHEYPFDSDRKLMTVLMREKKSGKVFVFTKGAPQSILKVSNHIFHQHHLQKIDKKREEDFLSKNERMAEKALRVLAFAFRELTPEEEKLLQKKQKNSLPKEKVEKDLTIVGLTGMIDPPRPEVKDAVQLCRKAGIRIFIITGDYGATAKAVAKDLTLFDQQKNEVITGEELNQLQNDKLKQLLADKNRQIIFARVTPEHKLRIVSLLKELGEIVAVTGDGVNDAPALKRADIGVAMGSGTDVSKEASNMILADDSFSTIVKAIQEGRTIYENLRKFIFFIFSSNIGELWTIFLAIILALPSPLTAIMILFINLFTDILPALALGVEPTHAGIMKKKPRNPKEKILNKIFLKRVFFIGFLMGIVVIGLFVFQLFDHGWTWGQHLTEKSIPYREASTMAFILLVFTQMANAFNAKDETQTVLCSDILKNWKLLAAIFISILLTIIFVETPFFQEHLNTIHLDVKDWIIVALGSLSIIFIEEIRKLLVRHFTKNNSY